MAEQTSSPWTPFLGKLSTTLALPDYYANYFAYSYNFKDHPFLGLRISGEFGYARYMSYNLYDERSGKSLTSLLDINIQPSSNNPYIPTKGPAPTNRQYTVNVFCSDNIPSPPPPPPPPAPPELLNPLTFSKDEVTILVVILRYYLPVETPEANVALPTIEAFDTQTGASITDLPPSLVPATMPVRLYAPVMAPIFSTISGNTIRFYHVIGGGEYNNADNSYLIAAVEKQLDEVLLVNLKAPTYSRSTAANPLAEVRYWSFNQGNADTSTPTGTADEAFKVAMDGRTYIAMGEESIQEWALKGGYNFMCWDATPPQAVILYRNLVTNTNFPGIINDQNVPIIPLPVCGPDDPKIEEYAATNSPNPAYVPYAPTGVKVSYSAFMTDYGGYPSPGFLEP